MTKNEFNDLEQIIYAINRRVSLKMALEKDFKKQQKYMRINRLLSTAITVCREKEE